MSGVWCRYLPVLTSYLRADDNNRRINETTIGMYPLPEELPVQQTTSPNATHTPEPTPSSNLPEELTVRYIFALRNSCSHKIQTLHRTQRRMSHEFINGNQEAVAMLQNGERDEAIAFFSGALIGIRQCVESAGQADQQGIACCRSPTRLPLSFEEQCTEDESGRETKNLICSLALGDCYELAESQTATPDNIFSFYNHAFVFGSLPEITTRTSQQEANHDTMISAVLIFNLALSFCGKGLCAPDGPKSSKYLRKALHLYSMAISLINDETGFEDLHALELASWNNIGYIYSHLSEHENAMKCRVHLYQALFADPDTSLRLTHSYSYSLLYLFVVSSEVRRREMRLSLAAWEQARCPAETRVRRCVSLYTKY